MQLFKYTSLTGFAIVAAGFLGLVSAKADPTPLVGLYNPSPFGFTEFSVDFTATSDETTLTALFRQDPAYWSFDNVSVTLLSGGPNLIVNGGFDTGEIDPWYLVGQQGLPAAGQIGSGWDVTPDFSWVDGAVGGVDGIAQNFATTTGSVYNLDFWLADDGGGTSSFEIYAGDAVTSHDGNPIVGNPGTGVPDSADTIALMGVALTALSAFKRKRK